MADSDHKAPAEPGLPEQARGGAHAASPSAHPADPAAQVLLFPARLSGPVLNPSRRGRYPRGVVSLRQARHQRSCAERESKQVSLSAARAAGEVTDARTAADRLATISEFASMQGLLVVPRGGFQVGDRAWDGDGRPVIVVEPYGLHEVLDLAGPFLNARGKSFSRRYGYMAQREDGKEFFFRASRLFDQHGRCTHLRLAPH